MPDITLRVKKGTSEEKKMELARAIAVHANELLKTSQVWTYFDEQEFILNGEKAEGNFLQINVSGPQKDEAGVAEVCKVFYDAAVPIVGEGRITFNYSSGGGDSFGINGLLFKEYLKQREQNK
ncbi:hypothetical protein LJC55_01840 [Eubacteriales bacterium OttesenSCG-928-N14]|nr:hypothetical protein [Eubacteriales bacterium OttesenSCG-928-N14]